MITITFLGLDQYIVGRLSREMTPNLAKLYEVNEDDINFVAPSNMVFHNGVEQTSWNVIVRVNAPMKVSVLQEDVAKLISKSVGEAAINLAIEFYYYSSDNRYERINENYPRYITSDNIVDPEIEYEELDEDEEVYDENIFEGFED
jgi:hypothetical protein